jgi:phospholipid/cholesterol/gamma-HCH transport system permease protein
MIWIKKMKSIKEKMSNKIDFNVAHLSEGQKISLTGYLNVKTSGDVWKAIFDSLETSAQTLIIDASQLTYCDMSGIALFIALQSHARDNDQTFNILGLSPEMQRLYNRFADQSTLPPLSQPKVPLNAIEKTGRLYCQLIQAFIQNLYEHIIFIGELTVFFMQAIRHPSKIRWKQVWFVAEKAGINALPIVCLIGFLMGLILAFQSVVPMSKFGAEIFVADLIGLAMIRELGPLMTAIVLAGRTGSAFAAELGAMKVNEEIDALTTMGLDPMNYLVVIRVMAALIVTPILTIYADLISVVGGAIPLISMGYPVVTYYNGVVKAVDYIDFISGLFKSVFFGLLVASAGCKCGLQTKTGAGAVGESTTRAVVNSIILIVICDGIFSVIFYYVGL